MKKIILPVIFLLLFSAFPVSGVEPVPIADNGSRELFFVPVKAAAEFSGRAKKGLEPGVAICRKTSYNNKTNVYAKSGSTPPMLSSLGRCSLHIPVLLSQRKA